MRFRVSELHADITKGTIKATVEVKVKDRWVALDKGLQLSSTPAIKDCLLVLSVELLKQIEET